ncbi:MAG: hypothetical protein JXL80_15420, partial [Planctomycetes bacterium]|nr:hypothetical protein [Planctomycetota bacterium]
DYYRSTLALPIRVPHGRDGAMVTAGFLTFDMATAGGFTDVPDIFKHQHGKYEELAYGSTIVNAAGVVADTLAALLWPKFNIPEDEHGARNGQAGDAGGGSRTAAGGDTPTDQD